jgi:hypothetical protein
VEQETETSVIVFVEQLVVVTVTGGT